MQNIRKRLLAAGLAAVISVSAASMPVWSDAEPAEAPADASEEGSEQAAEEDNGIYVTEEEAFEKLTLCAENSKLRLYADKKDCTFMVEDKSNGKRWWSGYYNTDTAPTGKTKTSRRNTLLSIDVVAAETKIVETSVRAYESSVEKKCTDIPNGIRFEFLFGGKYRIFIPLEVVINEDGTFTATVHSDEIKRYKKLQKEISEGDPAFDDPANLETDDNAGYQVLNVNLLENLGATAYDDEGMMIVPDGSGAVINYNNGTASGDNNTYEAKVYGEDIAVGKLYAGAVIEKVTMPVLATINKTQDAGLVMIATQGDACASAHAMVTGQNVTDLNSCWFEYALRTTDKYFMGNKNEPLTVYEANGIKVGDVSTTYYPIYGEDLSYNDVADVYRDYLTKNVGVTKHTENDSAPFYLTLYGGTVKTQSVMGFPVNIQTVATTYKEALDIIQQLEGRGVDNIKLIYEDFNEAGIVGEISAELQYSSKLGGKNDFTALKNYMDSKQYEFFPSCDIMEFYKSGNGYSFTLNSSKQITKAYATQTPFELAFGLPHLTKDSWTILSPYYFPDIFTKLVNSFNKENVKGISLNQASNLLYSDFSRENSEGRRYIIRKDTIGIMQAGYQKLKDSGFTVMTENANQYVLPYADHIKDVPLYSSNYDIFDYDIPFAEMVLHGLVPYTTKAINKSADAEELRLLALVTGTPIHYEMMYENPNKFADSEYDYLYYTNYTGWIDRSANEYKLFSDIIKQVSGAQINKFERLSEFEYQSEFEGGKTIYVNTDTGEIRYNNKSYKVEDYGLGVAEE